MSDRKALVITYHVKNCIRIGGFHYFIKYLSDSGYDVDWVTSPVSITWLFRRGDKENARNFMDLFRGIEWQENNNTTVRHFAVPLWIPAKAAIKLGMRLGRNYYPAWKKLRKKLRNFYDVILVEGVGCQYAENIRGDYPDSRIIYRPSDILKSFSGIPDPEAHEVRMMKASDLTLCVDENELNYYRNLYPEGSEKIKLLRNPITSEEDIKFTEKFMPCKNDKLSVVYVGISGIDPNLIDYAAQQNKNAEFYIVGPSGKSHDNVIYTGVLKSEEYRKYLLGATLGINPLYLPKFQDNIRVGYTRKIINYMKYLLPVVASNSSNYLDVPGFFCADSREEFAQKISEVLKYTPEGREKLREGYLRVMKVFSEEEAHKKFLEYIAL